MYVFGKKMTGRTKWRKREMEKRGWERNKNVLNWWLYPPLLSMSQTESKVGEGLIIHLDKIILFIFIHKTPIQETHGHLP